MPDFPPAFPAADGNALAEWAVSAEFRSLRKQTTNLPFRRLDGKRVIASPAADMRLHVEAAIASPAADTYLHGEAASAKAAPAR